MHLDLLKLRLDGVREAAARARLLFFTITIASLTLLTAAWNAYGSWYRALATQAGFSDSKVTERAQQELVTQWVKSQWISLGPLGISVGISDAAVVAAFGISIIAVWFFFAVRRENHEIGRLLSDVQLVSDLHVWQMTLHGIASNLVLIGVSGDDDPVERLGQLPGSNQARDIRWFLSSLFMLPAAAIFLMIVVDVLSIFSLDAPFRSPHEPLLWRLVAAEASPIPGLAFMFVTAATLGSFTYFVCRRVVRFQNATSNVVREFARELEQREKADPAIKEIPRLAPQSTPGLLGEFSPLLDLWHWLKRRHRPDGDQAPTGG